MGLFVFVCAHDLGGRGGFMVCRVSTRLLLSTRQRLRTVAELRVCWRAVRQEHLSRRRSLPTLALGVSVLCSPYGLVLTSPALLALPPFFLAPLPYIPSTRRSFFSVRRKVAVEMVAHARASSCVGPWCGRLSQLAGAHQHAADSVLALLAAGRREGSKVR